MQQYLLTEDQQSLIAMVKDFFEKEVLPIREEYDEKGASGGVKEG